MIKNKFFVRFNKKLSKMFAEPLDFEGTPRNHVSIKNMFQQVIVKCCSLTLSMLACLCCMTSRWKGKADVLNLVKVASSLLLQVPPLLLVLAVLLTGTLKKKRNNMFILNNKFSLL